MTRRLAALKTEIHRWIDPPMAWRDGQKRRKALANLADGEYHLPFDVPYVSQFASPALINDYIHHQFDGTQDPNWEQFGAPDAKDYAFWSPRVCALACLKMAIQAYFPDQPAPTLWELTEAGLAHDGYRIHDEKGHWLDEGWYVQAQQKLAARYGLHMTGYAYASPLSICEQIRTGHLVAATVTPELGERRSLSRRYGGHLVLVTGFVWQNRKVRDYIVHNPSGRYHELQAHARIPAARFHRSFAYRFATYEKHRKG